MAESRSLELPAQSYARHKKFVPGFHFVLVGLIVALALWALARLILEPGAETAFDLLVAVALFGLAWYTRTFPLGVQDRLIRLEMRLRLAQVLPPDLAARIPELRRGQLIGLRFASDRELPDLVRRCLAGELRGREQVKREVRDWQPDHHRI